MSGNKNTSAPSVGRIDNRVRFPDGTAAVWAEKGGRQAVSHWETGKTPRFAKRWLHRPESEDLLVWICCIFHGLWKGALCLRNTARQ